MSRAQIRNSRYTFAFGVDHFSGPYVQVWDLEPPATPDEEEQHEYDVPAVDCDKLDGLRVHRAATITRNAKLAEWCVNMAESLRISTTPENPHPHMGALHVIDLAASLGFGVERGSEVVKAIYELWD